MDPAGGSKSDEGDGKTENAAGTCTFTITRFLARGEMKVSVSGGGW